MTYADYDFYRNEYGGQKLDSETFNRLSKRGAAYITGLIGSRSFDVIPDTIKMAHCAVIEAIDTEENGGEITGQSVSGWSQSYSKAAKTAGQRQFDAAMAYLAGTGYVNRWL